MTDDDLVQSYVSLLPVMWSGPNTPNIQATIALLASTAIASQIVGQVLNGFALTSIYGQTPAVGKQLDVIGQFVGAQRSLPNFEPSGFFYSFQDTTGALNPDAGGFGDTRLGTPPPDYWASTTSNPGILYVLSDAQMIQLIQYLAAINHAEFTVGAIAKIFFAFFGTFVTVAETGPMQITITQSASDPGTLFEIVAYLGAWPKPAGVQLIVVPG